MPEISLPQPTVSSRGATTHTVHRATVLLQEALHDSRRATLTQEHGEIRGIHRLSAPPAAEVLVDTGGTADLPSPSTGPALVEAYFNPTGGRTPPPIQTHRSGGQRAAAAQEPTAGEPESVSSAPADPQLRGLIRDFKERQRKAGLIVAGSVTSAVTLTVVTIAVVFALAA